MTDPAYIVKRVFHGDGSEGVIGIAVDFDAAVVMAGQYREFNRLTMGGRFTQDKIVLTPYHVYDHVMDPEAAHILQRGGLGRGYAGGQTEISLATGAIVAGPKTYAEAQAKIAERVEAKRAEAARLQALQAQAHALNAAEGV